MLAQPQLPVPVPTEFSLSDLTAQIRQAHNEATAAVARGAWFAIQAGHGLVGQGVVKGQTPHRHVSRIRQRGMSYASAYCTALHAYGETGRPIAGISWTGCARHCVYFEAQALKLLGAAKKKRKRAAAKRAAT